MTKVKVTSLQISDKVLLYTPTTPAGELKKFAHQ